MRARVSELAVFGKRSTHSIDRQAQGPWSPPPRDSRRPKSRPHLCRGPHTAPNTPWDKGAEGHEQPFRSSERLADVATWRDRIADDAVNRSRVVELLEAFEAGGSAVEIPLDARRQDYVNVRPPAGSTRRGRICSVNVRTGRVEYQIHSWDRLVTSDGFDHLAAGNKAARTPATRKDVDAIVAAFRNEVAKTR